MLQPTVPSSCKYCPNVLRIEQLNNGLGTASKNNFALNSKQKMLNYTAYISLKSSWLPTRIMRWAKPWAKPRKAIDGVLHWPCEGWRHRTRVGNPSCWSPGCEKFLPLLGAFHINYPCDTLREKFGHWSPFSSVQSSQVRILDIELWQFWRLPCLRLSLDLVWSAWCLEIW